MPTLWGCLDQVDEALSGTRWILLRTVLPGGTAIRIQAYLGEQALIARGTERVELSRVKVGEFVEVTYHRGQAGFMEADTIYVRPDNVFVAEGSEESSSGFSRGSWNGR